MIARPLALAFGLGVLLFASTLPAAPPSDATVAAAKKYVNAGNEAYRAGRYPLAVRAYEEAFRLMPLPAITFSMAQAERLQYYLDRRREHLEHARELYRRYLDEAPEGSRRGHATLHLEAIEGILGPEAPAPAEPTVAPPPKPAPTELMVVSRTPNAHGRIDGGDFLDIPFDRTVAPGRRTVEVAASGYATARSEWIAVEGRLVVASLDLVPLPSFIEVSVPSEASVTIDGRAVDARETKVRAGLHVVAVTERGRRPIVQRVSLGPGDRASMKVPELELTDRRIAAMWTLGGAVTLALAGGVTTVLALSAEARVREYDRGIGQRNFTDAERADRNSDLDARDAYRSASWVLFGGAAALGVTGGVLWWFDHPSGESSTGGVSPVVGPGSAGAAWRTAF
jgi:tetratricopeptide (TPR) repeat protein